MKRSNLALLRCPACRKPYDLVAVHSTAETLEEGYLTCPDCGITIPVLFGFPLFAEQFLTKTPDLDEISQRVFGKPEDYLAFLDAKRDKPAWDLYAAFQPFNESTQALFPLIELLKEMMKPGDVILDLWCRTGWSGELLAAIFPEQQIISVWESYAGVLGAKGYHYWLGSGKRRPNLDIVFHSPNHPLPFADCSFAMVNGLDTLHRYHHVPLISECRRVVKPTGAIFFPHCHLTNSEPEPYFDRGEDQLHGTQYEEYFRRLFAGTDWKGYVLSEKQLFDAGDHYVLEDEPHTTHYNAAILLTHKRYEGRTIPAMRKTFAAQQHARVILNPLYRIDWILREVRPASDAMDGGAGELFYRHPMYERRLLDRSPISLTAQEAQILYWAERVLTVSEIAAQIGESASTVFEILLSLENSELVQLQNVSKAMARLQSFYSIQRELPAHNKATLADLWQRAQLLHGDNTYLIWPEDDSRFSYRDCDQIVRVAAGYLAQKGIRAGDRVILISESHPEFVLLFWAIVLSGAVAVPLSGEMNEESFTAVVEKTRPRLIFTPESCYESVAKLSSNAVVVFGCGEDSTMNSNSFSEALSQSDAIGLFPAINEDQDAAILFTSGSTGQPKGVVLSHGALYRSAEIMDREYHWRSSDVFLGAGAFHTMSGLRNPCLAALFSGLTVVLPGKEQVRNPMAMMTLAVQYGVTLLNLGPAFLSYWGKVSHKSAYFKDHTIRMVLCTGSSLHPVHRDNFEKQFGCPVYDYYGLTETSGVCILINNSLDSIPEKGIGRPSGCLIQIVPEDGELAIYGENLMKSYLGEPALTADRIRNGWFYTGDIARINPDGCVVLLGRKDRMLIDKNGENLYPDAIERAINSIDRVIESYVTGYQDASFVNQIAAIVSMHQNGKTDSDEAWIRAELAKLLPPQHIPSLILFLQEIPKSSGGKVAPQAIQHHIQSALKARADKSVPGGNLSGDRGLISTN